MLSVTDNYLQELNPQGHLELFGQDYNAQAYAICGSDMMIKGQSMENIKYGDSLPTICTRKRFDYMLANPPFGVEWKPQRISSRKSTKNRVRVLWCWASSD